MNRPAPGKSRLSAHVSTILLMVLACVSLVSLDLYQSWIGYDARLRGAKTETANLARSIAQQTNDAFIIADTALIGLRERVANDGTGPAAIERLEK
jgi:hypothetical protein